MKHVVDHEACTVPTRLHELVHASSEIDYLSALKEPDDELWESIILTRSEVLRSSNYALAGAAIVTFVPAGLICAH